MRTGRVSILCLLMLGLMLGYTPLFAQEAMVVPTSAIVPPTFTPTNTIVTTPTVTSPPTVTALAATNTVTAVVLTNTAVPIGSGGTQTAVAAVTKTALANQNLTATVTQTLVPSTTAIIVVVTSTPQPTKTQPSRLPNTGIIDGIEVWQNQPLVVVMAITGILGLAFLFYGQRH